MTACSETLCSRITHLCLQYHEKNGVKFHMKSKVAKILPSDSDPSVAGAVVIGDGGPTLPADVVIMGVGVAPATGFLRDSGFNLEKDGGLLVDEYLRVKGLENVYAIGQTFHHSSLKGHMD